MTQETFKKLSKLEKDLVIRGPARMLTVLFHKHKIQEDKLSPAVRLTILGSDFPHKTLAQMNALQQVRDSMLFERESQARIFCAWSARNLVHNQTYLMYDRQVREIIATCPVPEDIQDRIYAEYLDGLKNSVTPQSTYRTGSNLARIAYEVVRCCSQEICVRSLKS